MGGDARMGAAEGADQGRRHREGDSRLGRHETGSDQERGARHRRGSDKCVGGSGRCAERENVS